MKEQELLPQWLKDIEGQVRQFREFQSIENDLDSFIHVDSLKETTAHMAVRLEIENTFYHHVILLVAHLARGFTSALSFAFAHFNNLSRAS